jgi:glycosyltransferase involved in cell wall biosynthesis
MVSIAVPANDVDSLRSTPGKIARFLMSAVLPTARAGRGILMVTRADLFPANHGAAVKIDRTAWALSRLAVPVFLVTDDRKRYHRYIDGKREVLHYPLWLSWIGPWRRRLRRTLCRLGVPRQDVFLYLALLDWSLLLRAAYVASRHGARVFQAEFPAYARVCLWVGSWLGGLTVLVEHNVEFKRLLDQYKSLTSEGYAFLRRIEVDLCNQVDLVIAVSKRDSESLVRHGVDSDRVHVIPHGVDISSFDAWAAAPDLRKQLGIAPDRPLLVYHGTYLYPPNLEAVQVLANEILPRLSSDGLRPTVLAIGPNPPTDGLHSDILFLGNVDSVAPYIKAADVAVVPLLRGGGTRMKVLDYFAASVPVVSTSKGVEGLGLTDGEQLMIRDGYDAFAEAIGELLQGEERARSLGAAGRRYVEQFDWLKIAGRYVELFDQSPSNRTRCAARQPAHDGVKA